MCAGVVVGLGVCESVVVEWGVCTCGWCECGVCLCVCVWCIYACVYFSTWAGTQSLT